MSPQESGGLPGVRHVLFIQGGGVGAYDDWDHKLVASLQRELGAEHAVRYPRMPDEDDPSWAAWGPTIRAQLEELDRDAVVVGHSVGGTLLVYALASERQRRRLGGIVLIGTPFVGAGGWPGDEFEFTAGLGERLPEDAAVHVVHGRGDETVPSSHAALYAQVIKQAHVHLLAGRDHQLNENLAEVAAVINGLPSSG
jgi:predicted alpha/beta hydrolase family esterase